MKVLQICNQPPYPPTEGGSLAANFVTQGLLKSNCTVKVLAMSTFKKNIRREDLPINYVENTQYESVFIDIKIKPFPAIISFIKKKSYHIQRFISKEFAKKIEDILDKEHFDIIHLEGLFLTPYIDIVRKKSDAKIVMRSHNVEHKIWEQIALVTKNPIKRFYINHLAKTIRKYELSNLNNYDGMVCITQNNLAYFQSQGCAIPMLDMPFGVSTHEIVDDIQEEFPSLFHIGTMNWIPNEEGIKWFLEEVWGYVNKELPNLKFHLAGRHMPSWIKSRNYPNVVIEGEVADAMGFICSKSIMVVPLLSGSGIRVKIIEAMSAGKVVVTTTIGAEGIKYTDNENIIIANTPAEFVQKIKLLVNNKDLCEKIGSNAQNLILTQYNTPKLIGSLIAFYKSL